MTDKVLITRPRIAERLRQAGIELETVQNPYKTEFKAWLVERSNAASEIIGECYREIYESKRNIRK